MFIRQAKSLAELGAEARRSMRDKGIALCDKLAAYQSHMRKPQVETLNHLRGICNMLGGDTASGSRLVSPGFLIGEIAPGGGKSYCAVMAASVLVGSGFFDFALWMTPRRTLLDQALEDFTNTSVAFQASARLFPMFNPAGIRAGKFPKTIDEALGGRNQAFVLAYQGMSVAAEQIVTDLANKYRLLIIFDEFQLLKDHNKVGAIDERDDWWKPLAPIVEASLNRTGFGAMILSGKLSRNDGKKLPRVTYRRGDVQRGEDDKREYPMADIVYTIADGQRDHALIAIDSDRYEGDVGFEITDGKDRTTEVEDISGLSDEFYDKKLIHLLDNEDVWQAILMDMLSSLDYHNQDCGYHGMYLVIARNKNQGKKFDTWLKDNGRKPLYIHSGMSDREKNQLQEFRRGRGDWDGLITIGIGYIGLSVPSLCHMAYLTNYRSEEWFWQAVGRIDRMDMSPKAPSWDRQIARIFAPKDRKMVAILNNLLKNQHPGVLEKKPKPPPPPPPPPPGPKVFFNGISASLNRREFNTNGVDVKDSDYVSFMIEREPILNALQRIVVERLKDWTSDWLERAKDNQVEE